MTFKPALVVLLSAALALGTLLAATPDRSSAYTPCGSPQTTFPIKVYVTPYGYDANITYAEMSAAVDRALQDWSSLPDSSISFERVSSPPTYGVQVSYTPLLRNPLPAMAESACKSAMYPRQPISVRSGWDVWDTDATDGIDANRKGLDFVLRHEMGHILGLSHSCVTDTAIMCSLPGPPPTPYGWTGLDWPIDDDAQLAMATWYPNASPSPTPSPTPTPAPTLAACERRATYSNGQVVTVSLPLADCS